ncbi:MAG TPA: hypothetical protein VNT22_00650 [Baekduia sp.]|nr:hypothetical protein [Baekduia sp.]
MQVELLYWDGCPSHPEALSDLKRVLLELGIDTEVALREVTTDAQAAELGFVGSPTIRVDGDDLFDTGGAPPSLTCRVYRTRDGRFSATPDPEELRDVLAARH